MNKFGKLLIFYSLLVAAVSVAAIFWVFNQNQQNLTLDVPDEYTKYVALYHAKENTAKPEKDATRRVDFTPNSPVSLPRGTYIAEFQRDGFEYYAQEIRLDSEKRVIQLQYARLPQDRKQILDTEKTKIHEIIQNRYPEVYTFFAIGKESIYEDGSWYGAVLQGKKDTSLIDRDSLRIVLKKVNDSWKIKAKPYPTISQSEYPDIPIAIIKDLNKRSRNVELLK